MDEIKLKAPVGANKRKKVKGRGEGTGKGGTCGRGHKGQKARSGGGVRPGFEGGQMPLYRRIARRGFSNNRFKTEYEIINLIQIEKKYSSDETVDKKSLYNKRLINKKNVKVKILGEGEITKKLTINVDKISASALKKMKDAGCKILDTAYKSKIDNDKKNKGLNHGE
jgi:large subunit ribosomal protein L15